jgi:hypothetical protein
VTGDLTGMPGPDRPVPYSLTAQAEAELGAIDPAPDAGTTAATIDAYYGRRPGTAARLYAEVSGPDPEVTWEAVIEAADEWDSADSAAYQARVEAGLEPEADGEPGSYPSFDDDPARWGLNLPEPQTAAELAAEAELDACGPERPYASYSEWLADGQREPEAEP